MTSAERGRGECGKRSLFSEIDKGERDGEKDTVSKQVAGKRDTWSKRVTGECGKRSLFHVSILRCFEGYLEGFGTTAVWVQVNILAPVKSVRLNTVV